MRRRSAVLAALLLVCHAGAVAQEVKGRIRETYQTASSETNDTESLLQNYEISFKNPVAQGLYWQARLRALLAGFDQSEGVATDTRLLEPFLQVVYEGPSWQASAGSRMTQLTPLGDTPESPSRKRQDLFGRIAWSAERRPRFDWSVARIEIDDSLLNSSTEDRSLLTLAYGGGLGNTSLGLEGRRYLDRDSEFTRDSLRGTWNGDLRRTLAAGRVTIGGQALVVQGRTDENAPRALVVDVLRRPRAGLYAVDTTPLSGALAVTLELIDANLTAPAADLSGDFRNLGVDLGFPDTVDMALVTIERRLLPGNEDDYAWDVYTSADGEFWSLAAGSVAYTFNGLENRFEIRFAPVSARFVKIVNTNFSRNEPPLAVTEILVSSRETRSGRRNLTESNQSGNLSVAWSAHPNMDVGFNTFASRLANDTGSGLQTNRDLNSTLTTTLRPADKVVTSLRLQAIQRDSEQGVPESDRIASLGLAVTPLPTLDLSVTGTHRRNTSPTDLLVQADSVNFRADARFLHDVETALDLGILRQEEGILGRTTSRRTARLLLATTLRPGLLLSNNWGVERIEYGGAGVIPGRTDLDLRSRLSYRPTRVLGTEVEYLYQEIGGLSGGSWLYDLDWLPFPGGALQLQFTLIKDRRSLSGTLRDETRLGARWTVNPRTILDLAYVVQKIGDPTAEAQRLASAFLEYRF
jgi:hypothetical protein